MGLFKKIKKVFKKVAPIAGAVIGSATGVGPVIGGSIGGALGNAVGGGNVLKGAGKGALTGVATGALSGGGPFGGSVGGTGTLGQRIKGAGSSIINNLGFGGTSGTTGTSGSGGGGGGFLGGLLGGGGGGGGGIGGIDLAAAIFNGLSTSKRNKRERQNLILEVTLGTTLSGEEQRATSLFDSLVVEAQEQRKRMRTDKGLENFRQFASPGLRELRKTRPEEIPLPDVNIFNRSGSKF